MCKISCDAFLWGYICTLFWPRHQVLFDSDLGSQLHLTLIVQIKCMEKHTAKSLQNIGTEIFIQLDLEFLMSETQSGYIHRLCYLIHT